MPNYELKSIVMSNFNDIVNAVRVERKIDYLMTLPGTKAIDARINVLFGHTECIDELFENMESAPIIYAEANRIVDADKQRKKRLKQRIERIFSKGRTYFITLTFNEDTMASTDVHTRRVYVTRFLKEVSPDYVGNIDFGAKGGREHYHAVIFSDKLDDIQYFYSKKYGWICSQCEQFNGWTYGYYSIKSCGTDNKDKSKLAWYVSKLTNHSIKETTKRNALIYSR